MLDLSYNTYYNKVNPRETPEETIKAVKLSYYGSGRAYGQEKIAIELRQQGIPIANKTVKKIMDKEGLVSKYILKRKSNKEQKVNKDPINNTLDRTFGGYEKNEVIVSDLTYVSVNNKWCYICLIIELSHREIIGHAVSDTRDADLVKEAIYSIKENLNTIGTFHTDRGGEFKNEEIETILDTFGIKRSLSRAGKPIDNAVAESMYDILKTEFIFDEIFTGLDNLKDRLTDWIYWYNNKRLHGSLGMIPPVKSKAINRIGVARKMKPDYKSLNRKKKLKTDLLENENDNTIISSKLRYTFES